MDFCSNRKLLPTGMLQSTVARRELDSSPTTSGNTSINEDAAAFRDTKETGHLEKRQELGRQRIEFLSWPGTPAGETWTYRWKSFVFPGFSTNGHFFHTWQLLRRDGSGGPVLWLDFLAGQAVLGDTVRGTRQVADLSHFSGNTIKHFLHVKYGPNGTVTYVAVQQSNPKKVIVSYAATGDMGSNGSLKFGMYRPVYPGISTVHNLVGDYSATKFEEV
ncbi:hypothetical protein T439DRAFT_352091 [Meredithblackwellia eburnea MCA 4105]